MKNYYDILEISHSSTYEEIRNAFRTLALKYHPDKNKTEEAKIKFIAIVEAYEILSDTKSRKKYDDSILENKNTFNHNWSPSADFRNYYSYENIKRFYSSETIKGGMWEINEKANFGMWKATLVLFGSLGVISVFIITLIR